MTTIYTIGHSNHPIDFFIGMLQDRGIERLVDVRSKPKSSYNPQFNKDPLCQSLHHAGIEYFFGGKYLGGLNGPSIHDPEFIAKITRVYTLGYQKPLAMMCSEKDPKGCHRAYKLTAWLLRNIEGVSVQHIYPVDTLFGASVFEGKQSENWLWHEYGGTQY